MHTHTMNWDFLHSFFYYRKELGPAESQRQRRATATRLECALSLDGNQQQKKRNNNIPGFHFPEKTNNRHATTALLGYLVHNGTCAAAGSPNRNISADGILRRAFREGRAKVGAERRGNSFFMKCDTRIPE